MYALFGRKIINTANTAKSGRKNRSNYGEIVYTLFGSQEDISLIYTAKNTARSGKKFIDNCEKVFMTTASEQLISNLKLDIIKIYVYNKRNIKEETIHDITLPNMISYDFFVDVSTVKKVIGLN